MKFLCSNRHHYETSMRCVYCVLCVEMFICHNLFVVPHVNLISKATGACIEKRQALCNTLQRIASKHKHKDMYFCNVGAYYWPMREPLQLFLGRRHARRFNSDSGSKRLIRKAMTKCHIKITQQFPSEKSVSCHHL